MSEFNVAAVLQDGMHFVSRVGERSVSMDYPLAAGESGAGPRPLEMASCAGTALVALLRRAGRTLAGLTVSPRGQRRSEHPTVFTAIALEFVVRGDVDEATVARAIAQAEARVCPVWAMLKTGTPITSSFRVLAPEVAPPPGV